MSTLSEPIGNNKAKLHQYFTGMKYYLNASNEANRRLDKVLASSFSVFDYVSDKEIMLSRVLSDLLNPRGSHGQGDLFLKKFLTVIKVQSQNLYYGPIVTLERHTKYLQNFKRRIDIHLDWGSFGIGIENKPWANEQDNQLKDYNEQLQKEFGNNYVLVYLCAADSTLSSISNWDELTRKGNAATLHFYPDFYEWLLRCREKCEAEKVRYFLKDFADFVEQHFKI